MKRLLLEKDGALQARNRFADLPLWGQAAASPCQHRRLRLSEEMAPHTLHRAWGFSALRPSLCWALLQVCRLREAQGLRLVLARRGSFAMSWPSNDANPASLCRSQMAILHPPPVPGSLPCYVCSSCICTDEQFSSLCPLLRATQAVITRPQGRGESAHYLPHLKPPTHVL